MDAKKTIVIGLDGAHFELIEPWIEDGELQNIECAIERGVTADMQSVLPPVTSPNWKAYATGKNPGKLGIFWWENVDMAEERVYYPDDRKSAHPEFWEIIGDQTSAGVVNVPTTYPPRKVNPFIVAGAPDGAESGYTHPPEIEDEIVKEFDYRVTKNTIIKNNPDRASEEIIDLIDLRFRTGKYLLEKFEPEFFQITTFYLNSLHHFFWDDQKTLEGWKVVDKHLEAFLDEGYNVVMMSDHGATSIDTVFHINTWLEQEGYLTQNMGITDTFGTLGITTDRLIQLTSRLRIRDLTKRMTPQWLLNQIPSEEGEVTRECKTANLDWAETNVLASGQGPVYVDNGVEDYEGLRSELIENLSKLTAPNGTRIAESVHRGEEVYEGTYMDEAPDIVIDQTSGVHIQGGLGRDEVFTQPKSDGWKGENKRDAFFVATGPDFAAGSAENLSILDLAPTFLHLHGHEVPRDFDGEVRTDIYNQQSDVATRSVKYTEATDALGNSSISSEEEDVRDRLKDLGYIN